MDEYRIAIRVLMAEVCGGRVRGRQKLVDGGMKLAFGSRGIKVGLTDNAGKIGRSREPSYICR